MFFVFYFYFILEYLIASINLKPSIMSHEKTINDGKKKKAPAKSLKERRAEKKAKHEDSPHARKPRLHQS